MAHGFHDANVSKQVVYTLSLETLNKSLPAVTVNSPLPASRISFQYSRRALSRNANWVAVPLYRPASVSLLLLFGESTALMWCDAARLSR